MNKITQLIGLIVILLFVGCSEDSPTSLTASDTIIITKISGDGQAGVPGDTLSVPLTVLINDNSGNVLSGRRVDFKILLGSAILSDSIVITNDTGKASTMLILGDQEGDVRVEAKVFGTDNHAIFNISANNLPPASLQIISGNNQKGYQGDKLPYALQVVIENERDMPIIGAVVTFNIAEGAGTLSALSDTTNSFGVAKTWLTLGADAEIILVIAKVSGTEISEEFKAFSWKHFSTNKIAFESWEVASVCEIYIMDVDGSNQIRLTDNSDYDSSPSWSPDGSKIVFRSRRDGNAEIYVMNADGSNRTRLTDNSVADFSPSWSPDGSQIAFTSGRDGNNEIYVMNADGSNPENITNNPAEDSYPSWSPDGSQIAFTSDRDGKEMKSWLNDEIYVMNADGSNQTRLTDNSDYDRLPSWSPDGSQIAFTSGRDGNYEIYTMNPDGSNQNNLTDNSFNDDFSPSWSPDGSQIAFHSYIGINSEIYIMDADGSNQTRLTDNPEWDTSPAWSPF